MPDVRIREARSDEFGAVAAIERAAGSLFDSWRDRVALDDGTPTKPAMLEEARARGDLIVAVGEDDAPVGFCFLGEVDGEGHLWELDVHPDHGRKGIGRALVEFTIETMRARGYAGVTLTTFRDVPWNRPFYETAGFVVIQPDGPGMQAIVVKEESLGLDFTERCAMRRAL
jgi:ribosomal protein S18 acetylase RimI-like enzyme